jgi:hypothetical protein
MSTKAEGLIIVDDTPDVIRFRSLEAGYDECGVSFLLEPARIRLAVL